MKPQERIEMLQSAVRPLVTLILVSALVWGFAVGKISGEVFMQMVSAVVMFWFAQRQAEKREGDLKVDDVASKSVINTETTINKSGG